MSGGTYCGLDPGLDGCLCVLEDGELEFHDMPTVHGAGTRRLVDVAACTALLRDLKIDSSNPLIVAVERVGPMPKQGVVSTFSFGFGFGIWIGILSALEIPFELVAPAVWKKAMMPGEAKTKDSSRVVARRLWPDQTEESLSRKRDHNRADAALLAEYLRRKNGSA